MIETRLRMTEWPKAPWVWQGEGKLHISVPFTWNLPEVRNYIKSISIPVIVGGPAVRLMPHILADVATIGGDAPGVLQMINVDATRTMTGCPKDCGFCGVSKIEPEFSELGDWPDGRIICDNNLLACSNSHVDRVIDRLKGKRGVDFNQGLDAELLTQHHADRLSELDAIIRLAWDDMSDERFILRALNRLRKAKIPRDRVKCYVLIGFNDTPEDALYRLEMCYYCLGIKPNPMRYSPIDSVEQEYVGPKWTEKELTRYMRYWSNLRKTAGVPFKEFE